MVEEHKKLTGQKVVLREKQITDAPNDYAWRCDPELSRFDAASPLKLSFQEYLLYYAEQLRYPKRGRYWFAINTIDGRHIGNCMYYDIDENRKQAKLGVIIGDRGYWDKGYGTDAVKVLLTHIFEETDMERVYLDTLEWNLRAQRCFEKCGFVICGRISKKENNFIIMELQRGWLKPTQSDTT